MKSSAGVLIAALCCCALGVGPANAAGDAQRGKFLAETCHGCHNAGGIHNAPPNPYHVPQLYGQNAEYLLQALKEYKAGDRSHPGMQAITASLSEQDMADIAAYFSSQPPVEAHGALPGNPSAGKEKSTACAACHGPDGNSTGPTFPKLAGQYADYLLQALKEYKSGARNNPIMKPQVANLSEQDMADLASYFATQKPTEK